MEISAATPEDALAMAKVHVSSWQVACEHILDPIWLSKLSIEDRATRWQRILSGNESTTLVARRDTNILAFVSFGPCRDEGAPPKQGELWALYAAPECWGQGAGFALTTHALEQLKEAGYLSISLWVLSQNHRGRRFYEACGFLPVAGSEKTFELGGKQVQELMYLRANDA